MARYNPRKIRNAYILASLSVTLVLTLLGCFSFAIYSIYNATHEIMDDASITVVLSDELELSADSIGNEILKIEGVVATEYISKERAKDEFLRFTGEDVESILGKNPLPATFNVNFLLADEYGKANNIDSLVINIRAVEGVSEVLYQRDLIDSIVRNITILYVVMGVFFLVVMLISLMLINNTIKMLVYSKRFLIKTMKLVGATDSFVRKPFIIAAIKQSIITTVIAAMVICGLIYIFVDLGYLVVDNKLIYDLCFLFGGMLVVSLLICLLTTHFAVNRYANTNSNSLHTY